MSSWGTLNVLIGGGDADTEGDANVIGLDGVGETAKLVADAPKTEVSEVYNDLEATRSCLLCATLSIWKSRLCLPSQASTTTSSSLSPLSSTTTKVARLASTREIRAHG